MLGSRGAYAIRLPPPARHGSGHSAQDKPECMSGREEIQVRRRRGRRPDKTALAASRALKERKALHGSKACREGRGVQCGALSITGSKRRSGPAEAPQRTQARRSAPLRAERERSLRGGDGILAVRGRSCSSARVAADVW